MGRSLDPLSAAICLSVLMLVLGPGCNWWTQVFRLPCGPQVRNSTQQTLPQPTIRNWLKFSEFIMGLSSRFFHVCHFAQLVILSALLWARSIKACVFYVINWRGSELKGELCFRLTGTLLKWVSWSWSRIANHLGITYKWLQNMTAVSWNKSM